MVSNAEYVAAIVLFNFFHLDILSFKFESECALAEGFQLEALQLKFIIIFCYDGNAVLGTVSDYYIDDIMLRNNIIAFSQILEQLAISAGVELWQTGNNGIPIGAPRTLFLFFLRQIRWWPVFGHVHIVQTLAV